MAAIQDLCNDYRSHLLRRSQDGSRSSTFLLYHRVLSEVHDALRQRDPSFTPAMPSIEILEKHFAQSFPEIWLGGGKVSFARLQSDARLIATPIQHGLYEGQSWGRVDTIWRDKIMLWREVVVVLERSARCPSIWQGEMTDIFAGPGCFSFTGWARSETR